MNSAVSPAGYRQRFITWFDTRHARERVLLLAAITIVMGSLLFVALIKPMETRRAELSATVAELQSQLGAARDEQMRMTREAAQDPDNVTRARIAELEARLGGEKDGDLNLINGLVNPKDMARLVEDVLRHDARLHVSSLENLPVVTLGAPSPAQAPGATPAAEENAAPVLYKHGLRITVRGTYQDLARFFAALEKLPWKVLWSGVTVESGQYPQAVATLTLYTVSLERTWLML